MKIEKPGQPFNHPHESRQRDEFLILLHITLSWTVKYYRGLCITVYGLTSHLQIISKEVGVMNTLIEATVP
jgi:hypothetical protein